MNYILGENDLGLAKRLAKAGSDHRKYLRQIFVSVDITASFVKDSTIGKNSTVGPFAHVRNNSYIGSFCRIGNFVEIKNARLGEGTKASHLARFFISVSEFFYHQVKHSNKKRSANSRTFFIQFLN